MKAITVYYVPAGYTTAARYVASDEDGNREVVKASVAGDYPNPWRATADKLRAKMSWSGRMIQGSIRGGEVFVFDDSTVKTHQQVLDQIIRLRQLSRVATSRAEREVLSAKFDVLEWAFDLTPDDVQAEEQRQFDATSGAGGGQ